MAKASASNSAEKEYEKQGDACMCYNTSKACTEHREMSNCLTASKLRCLQSRHADLITAHRWSAKSPYALTLHVWLVQVV